MAGRDRLVSDLRSVVSDAEELLKATAGQAGDKVAVVRDKVQKGLQEAKAKIVEVEGKAMDRGKSAAKATDAYIRSNPWQSLGIAAGVGFLVGLFISRRR